MDEERERRMANLRDAMNRLDILTAKETLTSEERAEVRKLNETTDTLMAQISASDRLEAIRSGEGGEDRAASRVMRNYSVARVARAMSSQAMLSGAESEANSHFGIDGYGIPLAALDPQNAVTDGPATTPDNTQPFMPRIFPAALYDHLSVRIDTINFGNALYPRVTGGAAPGFVAEDAEADETAGTFAVTTASPTRLTAAARWRMEDAAAWPSMALENAIRGDLRNGLNNSLHKHVLDGSGANNQPSGLFKVGADPGAAGAITTYDGYRDLFSGAVDAVYARNLAEVKGVSNLAIYRHAAGRRYGATFPGTALEMLNADAGGLRPSPHAKASAGNVGDILLIRGGHYRARVSAWNGLELVFDAITRRQQGSIQVNRPMAG